jgi:4-amino-4-deoxy-L-arabinose transferase-like glycosyltransferase
MSGAEDTRDAGSSRSWLGPAWMILVTAGLALHVGDHALMDPDEGRNASIALGMATSHDYLIPRLNDLPFLDKPPLFFAVESIAMQMIGKSEFAARLPSLFFAVATVVLTAWFASFLFGRKAAWVAGMACATAPFTIVMARVAIFDSMLSFFIVLALIAFYRAVEAEAPAPSARGWLVWTTVAWIAMALGVLTKGPIALLIPLFVATPYALWRKRTPAVWHLLGGAIFLLMVLPWALAVERSLPGFLRYALMSETWDRLTTDQFHREGPIWYFLPYLLTGCFPWIVVVLASDLRRSEIPEETKRSLIFLALWFVLPLTFFSLSSSKRPQYILPLIPAIALATAWVWSRERPPVRGVRVASLLWIVLGGALLAASLVVRWPGPWQGYAAIGRGPVLVMGVLVVTSGILGWISSRHRGLALAALSLPLVMFTSIAAPLVAAVADSRSGSAMASALRPHLTSDTVIVGIDTFVPSLNFYLQRSIRLSSSNGEPLRSNYVLQDYDVLAASNPAVLRPGGWWDEALRSCSEPMIFLVRHECRRERMLLRAAGLPLLYQDGKVVAMGPCHQRLGRRQSEQGVSQQSSGGGG